MTRLLLPILFCLASAALLRADTIVLVAGGGGKDADAPAAECRLREPFGVEFTPSGGMLIVEMEHGQRVLKVDAQGVLRVLGGNGAKGFAGDGGPVAAAQFNGMHNLAVAPGGDVFLADTWNDRVRRIDAKTGTITTFAGTGKKGAGGDGGPAQQAEFSTIIQIALDPQGRHLYVTDIGNRRIRRIALSSGVVETVAGNGKSGVPPDGADAKTAPLSDPRAVAVAADGGFYILERGGNALRHVDPAGKIRTVAGTGKAGNTGDGGDALLATLATAACSSPTRRTTSSAATRRRTDASCVSRARGRRAARAWAATRSRASCGVRTASRCIAMGRSSSPTATTTGC